MAQGLSASPLPFGVHRSRDAISVENNGVTLDSLHCLSAFTVPGTNENVLMLLKGLFSLHCLSAFTVPGTWLLRAGRLQHPARSPLPFGVHRSRDSLHASRWESSMQESSRTGGGLLAGRNRAPPGSECALARHKPLEMRREGFRSRPPSNRGTVAPDLAVGSEAVITRDNIRRVHCRPWSRR